MATSTSCSTTFSQNGSNSGSPNERGPLEARGRGGTDEHHPGAPLDDPLELLDGLVDDGQRDDRGGEDPVLVAELPGLVEPLVEGVDRRVGQARVVAHALLEEAGQGGEHQRAVDALLVHQLDPRRRLAEGGDGPHRLAEDLAPAQPVRVALAEVVLLRARAGHHLEGRVRDVVADLAPDDDLRAAPHVDVVDGALVPVGQELRQRVPGLVEVVVGVEHGDVERGVRTWVLRSGGAGGGHRAPASDAR